MTNRFAVVVVLLSLSACSGKGSPTATAADVAEARRLVEQSEQEGYITRRTCIGNQASVTPHFWNSINAQTKEGVLIGLARICDAEDSGNRMTIFDAMSGKKLASFTYGSSTFY